MDLQITASEGQSPSESDEMASQLDSQKICHTLWDQLGSNFKFNRVLFFFFLNIFQIDIFFYISHNLILIEIRWLSYSPTTFCLWSEQKKYLPWRFVSLACYPSGSQEENDAHVLEDIGRTLWSLSGLKLIVQLLSQMPTPKYISTAPQRKMQRLPWSWNHEGNRNS